jgi:hypothetical protein
MAPLTVSGLRSTLTATLGGPETDVAGYGN